MKTVLLVDDEPRMLDLIELYLKPQGYKCIKTTSGKEAISHIKNEIVDIVILDVMMPELDGWETCESIRKFSSVPIIMLTARNQDEEMVKGLRKGADDYVTKPFNSDILLARMEAVIRRSKPELEGNISRRLTWDETAFELYYLDQQILLTPKEFSLLISFLKHPNKVFSRDHLLSSLWGYDTETEDRTVDSHIRNIREKLRQAGYPVDNYLKTVWGIGYKWSSE